MKKTKVFTSITAVILAAVLLFVTIVTVNNNTKVANAETAEANMVRTISLKDTGIDYADFFNEFEDAELLIDEDSNALKFSGKQTLSAELFSEINLISESNNTDGIDINYVFDYNANENKFHLSVIADTENGEIIDNWLGVPFVTENNKIDIAFATDDGVIFLSELEDSGVLENCGWLSHLWKAAVAVAVIAVVATVIVVAAPAVAAAATTVTTAVSVGGGLAALSAGTATAAVAAAATAAATAMGTTAFAIASTTATVAACIALTSYVADEYVELTKDFAESKKEEIRRNRGINGKIYYPCLRVGNDIKIEVLHIAVNAEVAVAWIKLGGNMYTYEQDDAAGILTLAGYAPSNCSSVLPGHYKHFHPFIDNKEVKIAGDGRNATGPKHSIHSFYGLPV